MIVQVVKHSFINPSYTFNIVIINWPVSFVFSPHGKNDYLKYTSLLLELEFSNLSSVNGFPENIPAFNVPITASNLTGCLLYVI